MPEPTSQLEAVLRQSAFASITNVGWLRVTGEDRVRWLNGMATNSIQALTAGQGNYNLFLNAQGRIQADATALLAAEEILLETRDPHALAALLDRFIIMDDVELGLLEGRAGLLLAGPESLRLLKALGAPVTLAPLDFARFAYEGEDVLVLHANSPLVPRYELWSDAATIGLLSEALRAMGAAEVGTETLEALRLLEATPLLGTDIREKDLAQETGLTRALHFAKGCYLGQEIVERIRSRGQVHRTLQLFRADGALPGAGTAIVAADKAVGEITSAAVIPLAMPITLALGYIRREALETHAPLSYEGGTAVPVTSPYSL